jgi:ATP-dependent protease Clp ATPase subunit
MPKIKTETQHRCSFCGANQADVDILIAGPSVYICNNCIDICVNVLNDASEKNGESLEKYLPVVSRLSIPQEKKGTGE